MPEPFASNGEAVGKVLVRLSDVPRELRVKVADEIVRRGGLRGIEAADLMLVAFSGKPDARIEVSREKAHRVLRERKAPLGTMPKVWTW